MTDSSGVVPDRPQESRLLDQLLEILQDLVDRLKLLQEDGGASTAAASTPPANVARQSSPRRDGRAGSAASRAIRAPCVRKALEAVTPTP